MTNEVGREVIVPVEVEVGDCEAFGVHVKVGVKVEAPKKPLNGAAPDPPDPLEPELAGDKVEVSVGVDVGVKARLMALSIWIRPYPYKLSRPTEPRSRAELSISQAITSGEPLPGNPRRMAAKPETNGVAMEVPLK